MISWKSLAPRTRRLILAVGSTLAVLVLGFIGYQVWGARGAESQTTAAAPNTEKNRDASPWSRNRNMVAVSYTNDDRALRARRLTQIFTESSRSLCSYRERTRYPNNSRPLAEQTDQMYPNRPVVEMRPMHASDGNNNDIQIQSSQTRVYLAAGETVTFTLRALDSNGKPLPMFVTRAVAHALTYSGTRDVAQVALDFNGDGGAGENGYTGSLTPRQTSMAGFRGTIRTDVSYNVGDKSGSLSYDVIYSPENPATWGGQISESTEGGSLHFHLRANVALAGRYVVTGRVEDAKGRPVALATFNDILKQGDQEVTLTVFGKLLADLAPSFPLTLRDVDGYLLLENTDPDRSLVPRLEGNVYTSKNYSPKNFSGDEWQSEERSRYLTELGHDVANAREQLHGFDPELEQQLVLQERCGAAM